jgi:hypothetical protein
MSYSFNGSSHSLQYDGAELHPSVYPLAVCCWFNSADSTQDNQTMWAVTEYNFAANNYFAAGCNTTASAPDGIRAYQDDDGNLAYAQTATDWVQDTWHSGVWIYTATNDTRVWIDGGGKTTSNTDILFFPGYTNKRLVIGAHQTAAETFSSFFNGKIGCWAVWDLTNWEGATASDKGDTFESIIPALAKGYSPLFWRNGLIGHFPLIRGLKDVVSGVTLTANGATVSADHPRIISPMSPMVQSFLTAAVGADVRNHIIPAYMRMNN